MIDAISAVNTRGLAAFVVINLLVVGFAMTAPWVAAVSTRRPNVGYAASVALAVIAFTVLFEVQSGCGVLTSMSGAGTCSTPYAEFTWIGQRAPTGGVHFADLARRGTDAVRLLIVVAPLVWPVKRLLGVKGRQFAVSVAPTL